MPLASVPAGGDDVLGHRVQGVAGGGELGGQLVELAGDQPPVPAPLPELGVVDLGAEVGPRARPFPLDGDDLPARDGVVGEPRALVHRGGRRFENPHVVAVADPDPRLVLRIPDDHLGSLPLDLSPEGRGAWHERGTPRRRFAYQETPECLFDGESLQGVGGGVMAEADVMAHRARSGTSSFGVPGFRVVRLVDEDELGVRYLAREQATGLLRTVRVVTLPLTTQQRQDLRRLWDAAALWPVHPFLSEVVAHGTTTDGAPWVATDGGADESLASRSRDHSPAIDASVTVSFAVGAAHALAELHARGLVHGGIGPAAIVREGSVWRLTDTGVAAIALPLPPATSTSPAGDTMAHAAAEVLAGGPPTPAADVYALAATVTEVLTGRPVVRWERGDTAGDAVPASVHAGVPALG